MSTIDQNRYKISLVEGWGTDRKVIALIPSVEYDAVLNDCILERARMLRDYARALKRGEGPMEPDVLPSIFQMQMHPETETTPPFDVLRTPGFMGTHVLPLHKKHPSILADYSDDDLVEFGTRHLRVQMEELFELRSLERSLKEQNPHYRDI